MGGAVEADIIGLMALATQFGVAGLQAVDTAVELTTGPLRRPGMLLGLAMTGPQGFHCMEQMASVAFAKGGSSMAGAAIHLGGDALDLGVEAIQFIAADPGYFTDPLATVPWSEASGQTVVRRIEFKAEGSVSFEGVTVEPGATIVVEYLANGRVKVSVNGKVLAGGDLSSNEAGSISLTGGPVAGVSWLVANERDAARLVTLLLTQTNPVIGTAVRAAGLAGVMTPIPAPQAVTLGEEAALRAGLTPGGVKLANGSLVASGKVTIADNGTRTYELSLKAEGSTALAGPVLNALPPSLRAQLPGGDVFVDPNTLEVGAGGAVRVITDSHNSVQSIQLEFNASMGQGNGIGTSYGSVNSSAGDQAVVRVTLTRDDLSRLGSDGQAALDALERGRPDQAVNALRDLGGDIVNGADVHIEHRDYTKVSGGISVKEAGTGGGLTLGATIDDLESSADRTGR